LNPPPPHYNFWLLYNNLHLNNIKGLYGTGFLINFGFFSFLGVVGFPVNLQGD